MVIPNPRERRKNYGLWIAGIMILIISFFLVKAEITKNRLQEQIIQANTEVIQEEETKQEEILKETAKVEEKIQEIEKKYKKAKQDENKISDNFEPYDAAAARRFVTEYAERRRAEEASAGDGEPGRP